MNNNCLHLINEYKPIKIHPQLPRLARDQREVNVSETLWLPKTAQTSYYFKQILRKFLCDNIPKQFKNLEIFYKLRMAFQLIYRDRDHKTVDCFLQNYRWLPIPKPFKVILSRELGSFSATKSLVQIFACVKLCPDSHSIPTACGSSCKNQRISGQEPSQGSH